MVQPANYNIDVQSPFQAFAQGAQLGTGLAEIQARRQAQQQDVIRQQQLQQENSERFLPWNKTPK